MNVETYYSFANIRDGANNSFQWNVDDSTTSAIRHIPTGCYELTATNAEIIKYQHIAIHIDCC